MANAVAMRLVSTKEAAEITGCSRSALLWRARHRQDLAPARVRTGRVWSWLVCVPKATRGKNP
jgi:predicted DNA-binding transcriptional regulator AlpA